LSGSDLHASQLPKRENAREWLRYVKSSRRLLARLTVIHDAVNHGSHGLNGLFLMSQMRGPLFSSGNHIVTISDRCDEKKRLANHPLRARLRRGRPRIDPNFSQSLWHSAICLWRNSCDPRADLIQNPKTRLRQGGRIALRKHFVQNPSEAVPVLSQECSGGLWVERVVLNALATHAAEPPEICGFSDSPAILPPRRADPPQQSLRVPEICDASL
jgi:hypothetical protein